jgi:hypothetical protein
LCMLRCVPTLLAEPNPVVRRIYERVHAQFGDHEVVELALLRESSLGPQSRWYPYLRMLPAHVPLPSSFTAGELQALQDGFAVRYAAERQRELRAQYAKLRDRIWGVLYDVPAAARAAHAGVDAYVWAASVVTSRMLSLRGHVHLVPLADMFSYSPNPVGGRTECPPQCGTGVGCPLLWCCGVVVL